MLMRKVAVNEATLPLTLVKAENSPHRTWTSFACNLEWL